MNIFYDLVRANKEFLCALLRKLILLIKIQNLLSTRIANPKNKPKRNHFFVSTGSGLCSFFEETPDSRKTICLSIDVSVGIDVGIGIERQLASLT